MFLRKGFGARLDATVEVDAPLSVVNASLPFADPIAPGFTDSDGVYRPWALAPYRDFDRRRRRRLRRRRALDRMSRLSQEIEPF